MVYQLKRKRKRAFIGVLAVVVSNSIIMAAPSLTLEVAKNIFLTFANIAMFILIWDTYFDDKLSAKSAWGILKDLLTITAVGTITTFITYRILLKAMAKLILSWGELGWILGGGVSGLATAIWGMIWVFYCDDLYRHSGA